MLKILYHHKCAYCESKIPSASSTARVDHFRPQNGSDKRPHNGYYWLVYEWSNLVLSCEICNNKTHKADKFPIEDERFRRSSPFRNEERNTTDFLANSEFLLAEKCLLIHPEMDEPKSHIAFTPDGKPKALSVKGRTTVEICGLARDGLNIERKKIVDKLRNDIRKLFYNFQREYISEVGLENGLEQLFRRALIAQLPKQQYSSFSYCLLKNFDYFIIQTLQPKIAQVVRFQFEQFSQQYGI